MAEPVLNYILKDSNVQNQDGSFPARLRGVTLSPVSDTVTWLAPVKNALVFPSTGGSVQVSTGKALKGLNSFAVDLPIKAGSSSESRMNLVESGILPFSLSLRKTEAGTVLHGSVYIRHEPRRGSVKTEWKGLASPEPIPLDKWITVGMGVDGGDVFLFVNGSLVARRKFLNAELGELDDSTPDTLFLGSWVDGRRNPFTGSIGAFMFWDGLSPLMGEGVKRARSAGTGVISSRYDDLGGSAGFLGAATGAEEPVKGGEWGDETVGRMQAFKGGSIWYSASTGAFEVHGNIEDVFKKYRVYLGFPRTDERDSRRSGVRRSDFENGSVYWSASTGASPLWGEVWLKYGQLGGVNSSLGLPIGEPESPGRCATFQNGVILCHDAPHEVHGDILARYKKEGGTTSHLGYPTSDELVVKNKDGAEVCRVSYFEGGAIFWSRAGTVLLTGRVLQVYQDEGGPTGDLGLPTAESRELSNLSYCSFENGLIVTPKGGDPMRLTELVLTVDRFQQVESESDLEDWPESDGADLYGTLTVSKDGSVFFSRRFPDSGYTNSNLVISRVLNIPLRANTTISVSLSAKDQDDGSPDETVGTASFTLNSDNGWGLFGQNNGVNNTSLSSKGGDVKSYNSFKLYWSVRPTFQQPDPEHFRQYCAFPFRNRGTPDLPKRIYAQAFEDVPLLTDLSDVIFNPWDAQFYEMVRGMASGGNCFGMSVMELRAWMNCSLYGMPLNLFDMDSSQLTNSDYSKVPALGQEINAHHLWQAGSAHIRWAVSQMFASLVSPKAVYGRVSAELKRTGACLLSMYDVPGGRGHTIVAFQAVKAPASGVYGRIYVADSNGPFSSSSTGKPHYIDVLDDDTFVSHIAESSSNPPWRTGSMVLDLLPATIMYHTPFSVVSNRSVTPFVEVMVLAALLGGLIVLAGDGEVDQVSAKGETLYTLKDGKRRLNMSTPLGLRPVPLTDTRGVQVLATTSASLSAATLTTEVSGTKTGKYRVGLTHANGSADVTMSCTSETRDKIKLSTRDSFIPQLTLEGVEGARTCDVSLFARTDAYHRPPRRYTTSLDVAKDARSSVAIDPVTGGLELVSASGGRPVDIRIQTLVEGKLQSAVLPGVRLPDTGRTLQVVPRDWNNILGEARILTGTPGAMKDLARVKPVLPE